MKRITILTVISIIIGTIIPVRRLSEGTCEKKGLARGSIGSRCLSSLISDCIYTPVITLAMTFLATKMAARMGGSIPFLPTFLKSFILSMILGFVLIFIFTPFYLRLVLRSNGIEVPETDTERMEKK